MPIIRISEFFCPMCKNKLVDWYLAEIAITGECPYCKIPMNKKSAEEHIGQGLIIIPIIGVAFILTLIILWLVAGIFNIDFENLNKATQSSTIQAILILGILVGLFVSLIF